MKNELQKKQSGEVVKFDAKAYLQKYEPVQALTTLRHIKTMEQAIEDDSNNVAYYSKQMGMDSMLALIELHLTALSESVNVGQPLTKFQIKEIAIEIHSMFYFLSMTEICFVLRKLKRGEYGQLYGALNIVFILDCFNKYAEERAQRFITMNTAEKTTDISKRSEERRIDKRHKRLKDEL